jgi:hypothetical protein
MTVLGIGRTSWSDLDGVGEKSEPGLRRKVCGYLFGFASRDVSLLHLTGLYKHRRCAVPILFHKVSWLQASRET